MREWLLNKTSVKGRFKNVIMYPNWRAERFKTINIYKNFIKKVKSNNVLGVMNTFTGSFDFSIKAGRP